MARLFMSALSAICLMLFSATLTAASDDILTLARNAPTRADGLAILEAHLAEMPQDVDARLVYGLILSWDGQYDEARRELRRVLAQAPSYDDARVALMNVEWWSGQTAATREQVNIILSHDPGHTQARLVRQRLDASSRPWQFSTWWTHDRFNDARGDWNEQAMSLTRQTPAGSVIVRGSRADRFGLDDQQVEADFYPTFRPGSYGFLSVGVSPDHTLYPRTRLAFDLYQNVGAGFEVSGGYRRLAFTETTHIYVATLTKYVGNWMLTGKVYHVPGAGALDSTSGHALVRRYYGADGSSFVGVGYSHGLSREEVRGALDLLTLDNDTVRGQFDALVTGRLRLQVEASTSRQQRVSAGALWQTSAILGFAVRF